MSVITIKIDTGELANAIQALAQALAGQTAISVPTATIPTQAVPTAVTAPTQSAPTQTKPKYTLEQLATAAAPLMDAGKQQELIALLQSYGVAALTQLPEDTYENVANGLRRLGAKI